MHRKVYKEKEIPDGVYLIDSGEFEITKNIYNNSIVNKFRISRLGHNQMFGLQECINQTKRTTSCTWISSSAFVYFIPAKGKAYFIES